MNSNQKLLQVLRMTPNNPIQLRQQAQWSFNEQQDKIHSGEKSDMIETL